MLCIQTTTKIAETHETEAGSSIADVHRLTTQEADIYRYINQQVLVEAYPPSIRKIGEIFEIDHKSVQEHLMSLVSMGLITSDSFRICIEHGAIVFKVELINPENGLKYLATKPIFN